MKILAQFRNVTAIFAVVSLIGVTGLINREPIALAIAGDFEGPSIVSYTFSPTTIDISNSSADVVVTARVTDASGVRSAPIIYIQNGANVSATQRTGYFVRTSGNAQDGTYSATITIPCGRQPGVWSVFSNSFRDTENNDSVWPVYPVPPQTLTVVNTGGICPVVVETTIPRPWGVSTSTIPIPSTIPASKPVLTMKTTLSAKLLATYAGLKAFPGSKVSLKAFAASSKICRVSGTVLKAIKKGTCRVAVTVKGSTGKKSSRNLTLHVRS